ncbi:MAG: nuclear transport factor 2 family protein [Alphaproteobacteria bacterium]
MKRTILAAAVLFASFAAPVSGQTPGADFKTFFQNYAQAFNKGDSHALATQFYDEPGASPADMEARLGKEIAALRADEFGKMNLFSTTACPKGSGAARVQVSFEYQYTYGGQMPPGDQSRVFDLIAVKDGWRIVGSEDLKPGQTFVCPKQ